MVQWLELHALTERVQVQSLIEELRYCNACNASRKKKPEREMDKNLLPSMS